MNLLVMGMNYAPERTGIAPYTTGLCEYLAARGHGVTVATTFPHYPEWKTQGTYAGKWAQTEIRNGVTIHRKRVYLPKRATTLRRILYDTSLSVGAFVSGTKRGNIDLILAILPPIQAGVAARMLGQIRNVPYTIWIQDLALEAALAVGMMHTSFLLRLARRMEHYVYARAAQVVVVAKGIQDTLARQNIPPSKLMYLPNWANPNLFQTSAENGFRHAHGIADDAIIVMHAGNMGVKQSLDNVLHAAEHLREHSDIEFVLVGDGSQKNALRDSAQSARLPNVRFLPLVPSAQLPAMMAAADIFLLNQHPDMVEAVIPSKLLSYMTAARPIVVAAHPASEASRQVRAANCGVWVQPDQPVALADAVQALAQDSSIRLELGQRGRAFAEKHFARESLLQQYEASLMSVVA